MISGPMNNDGSCSRLDIKKEEGILILQIIPSLSLPHSVQLDFLPHSYIPHIRMELYTPLTQVEFLLKFDSSFNYSFRLRLQASWHIFGLQMQI